MWLALVFLGSAILSAVLLFITVYYIIMFSDLELDYINPIDLCHRINKLLLPEMILYLAMTSMLLLSGRIIAILINLPLIVYHIYQILDRRYLLDATEVFKQLPYRKRESMAKLVFYILSFFFYLYSLVSVLIR